MFLGASNNSQSLQRESKLLDSYKTVFDRDCAYSGRQDYLSPNYLGSIDLFTDCRGSGSALIIIAARPADAAATDIVVAVANVLSSQDVAPVSDMMQTLRIIGELP